MLKVVILSTVLMVAIGIVTAASAYAGPMGTPAPDLKHVLDAQASLGPKPIETLTADDARGQPSPADGVNLVMKQKGEDPESDMGIASSQIELDGSDGPIPATLYTPKDLKQGKPVPVVVYYHGGGFVIATNKTYDATPRSMAKLTNVIFVSVEYRKAPENKFPAAHNDAFAAYKWVLLHAAEFGGDPKRVALMGESAGGNLAIDTAIAARNAGVQMPIYEVLVYPVAGVDTNTLSYQENAVAKPLNKPMMEWFFKNTIAQPQDLQDPRLNIVGKADLHGLPPTTVITAQIDPLRSDGQALAKKLKAAGVKTDARTYRGMTHEFFGMGAVVGKAKDAEKLAAKDLKSAF